MTLRSKLTARLHSYDTCNAYIALAFIRGSRSSAVHYVIDSPDSSVIHLPCQFPCIADLPTSHHARNGSPAPDSAYPEQQEGSRRIGRVLIHTAMFGRLQG